MGEKLTDKQRRILALAPAEWERPKYIRGINQHSTMLNPTLVALERKGWIERTWVPPRWRITDAGRNALTDSKP